MYNFAIRLDCAHNIDIVLVGCQYGWQQTEWRYDRQSKSALETMQIYLSLTTQQDFEATSGFVIDEARNAARNSYSYKPNVVLVGRARCTV
jgi:hypothetical protein